MSKYGREHAGRCDSAWHKEHIKELERQVKDQASEITWLRNRLSQFDGNYDWAKRDESAIEQYVQNEAKGR